MAWLDRVWASVQHNTTRMARRKVASVHKYCGERHFLQEAKGCGYHVAKVGAQYLVFRDAIEVKC